MIKEDIKGNNVFNIFSYAFILDMEGLITALEKYILEEIINELSPIEVLIEGIRVKIIKCIENLVWCGKYY